MRVRVLSLEFPSPGRTAACDRPSSRKLGFSQVHHMVITYAMYGMSQCMIPHAELALRVFILVLY